MRWNLKCNELATNWPYRNQTLSVHPNQWSKVQQTCNNSEIRRDQTMASCSNHGREKEVAAKQKSSEGRLLDIGLTLLIGHFLLFFAWKTDVDTRRKTSSCSCFLFVSLPFSTSSSSFLSSSCSFFLSLLLMLLLFSIHEIQKGVSQAAVFRVPSFGGQSCGPYPLGRPGPVLLHPRRHSVCLGRPVLFLFNMSQLTAEWP